MTETCVRSVKKALDALDLVLTARVGGKDLTLTELAAGLGEKPTTLRNILKTMEQCGYLSRDGKLYTPGAKCCDMRRAAAMPAFVEAAQPLFYQAAAETGESFVLTTLHDGRRVVVARFEGGSQVVVNFDAADHSNNYTLVTTRAMLSRAAPEAVKHYIERNGLPKDDWPEAAADGLPAALERVRRVGHAVYNTEQVAAYAVPLVDAGDALLGAAGCSIPRFRFDAEREKLVLGALHGIAAAVARRTFN